MFTITGKICNAQACFVFAWLPVAIVSPRGAHWLAALVSPLAAIAFWLRPHYNVPDHFSGPMGADFYWDMTGETFLIGTALAVMLAVVYVGRYWRMPWRLVQFALERTGTRASWFGALGYLASSAAICALFGCAIAVFYGFVPVPDPTKDIKLFQFTMWALLASIVPWGCVLFACTGLSAMALIVKKLVDAIIQE